MTTTILAKRVAVLEKEVQSVKAMLELQQRASNALAQKGGKKLSSGLRKALQEAADGKIEGPFKSVEELMTDAR